MLFHLSSIFPSWLVGETPIEKLQKEAIIHFVSLHTSRNISIGSKNLVRSFKQSILEGSDIYKIKYDASTEDAAQIMPTELLIRKCDEILAENDEAKLQKIIDHCMGQMNDYETKSVPASKLLDDYRDAYSNHGLEEVIRHFRIALMFSVPNLATDQDHAAIVPPDMTDEEFDERMEKIKRDVRDKTDKLGQGTNRIVEQVNALIDDPDFSDDEKEKIRLHLSDQILILKEECSV